MCLMHTTNQKLQLVHISSQPFIVQFDLKNNDYTFYKFHVYKVSSITLHLLSHNTLLHDFH